MVAMDRVINLEDMASTFRTHGVVSGSRIMPTPADSWSRVLGFPFLPFPFAGIGMVVCSDYLDEK